MIIIYIDIILLVILLCLTVSTCIYCVYRVYTLQRDGQVEILLRPTKVLFSHKKEGEAEEELRTVVAYRNPFTGDYCVHKNRTGPTVYTNRVPDSPDSGLSDEYEPLHEPLGTASREEGHGDIERENILTKPPLVPKRNESTVPSTTADYTVSKTWNWNYTEYQI